MLVYYIDLLVVSSYFLPEKYNSMKKVFILCLLAISNFALAQTRLDSAYKMLNQLKILNAGDVRPKTTSLHSRVKGYSHWYNGILTDTAHYYYSGSRGSNFPSCVSSFYLHNPQSRPDPNSDYEDIIKADSFFHKQYSPTTGAWMGTNRIESQFDLQNKLTLSKTSDTFLGSPLSQRSCAGFYSAGRLIRVDDYSAAGLAGSIFKFYDGAGNLVKDSSYNWGASNPGRLDVYTYDAANRLLMDSAYSPYTGASISKTNYYYSAQLDSTVDYINLGTGSLVLFSRIEYKYNVYGNCTKIESTGEIGTTSASIYTDSFAYSGSNPNNVFYSSWSVDLASSSIFMHGSASYHLNSDGNWDTIYSNSWNSAIAAFEPGGKEYFHYNTYCLVDTVWTKSFDAATGAYANKANSRSIFYYDVFEDGIADDHVQGAGISVYPNPAQGILHMKWTNEPANKQVNVSVTNLLGQEVFAEKGYWSANGNHIQTSSLSPGIYILSIRDETGGVIHKERIVKQ